MKMKIPKVGGANGGQKRANIRRRGPLARFFFLHGRPGRELSRRNFVVGWAAKFDAGPDVEPESASVPFRTGTESRAKLLVKRGAAIGVAAGATFGAASLITIIRAFYEIASSFSKNITVSVAPSMTAGWVVASTAAGAAIGAAIGAGAAAISSIVKAVRSQRKAFQPSDDGMSLF